MDEERSGAFPIIKLVRFRSEGENRIRIRILFGIGVCKTTPIIPISLAVVGIAISLFGFLFTRTWEIAVAMSVLLAFIAGFAMLIMSLYQDIVINVKDHTIMMVGCYLWVFHSQQKAFKFDEVLGIHIAPSEHIPGIFPMHGIHSHGGGMVFLTNLRDTNYDWRIDKYYPRFDNERHKPASRFKTISHSPPFVIESVTIDDVGRMDLLDYIIKVLLSEALIDFITAANQGPRALGECIGRHTDARLESGTEPWVIMAEIERILFVLKRHEVVRGYFNAMTIAKVIEAIHEGVSAVVPVALDWLTERFLDQCFASWNLLFQLDEARQGARSIVQQAIRDNWYFANHSSDPRFYHSRR